MGTAIVYNFYSDKDGKRDYLLYQEVYYPTDLEDLIRVIDIIKAYPAKYELITKIER